MSADDIAALTGLLRTGRVLVLTGAGISTDSGIPDYRGPDGRHRRSTPMTYDRFMRSESERRRYWARSHVGWSTIATARPNSSHRAVTTLEGQGLLSGVVTQNVDGLHSAAGTRDVVELHGQLAAVVCLDCGRRRSRLEIGLRLDALNPGFREAVAADPEMVRPDGDVVLSDEVIDGFTVVACRHCGGILKPDVVFFGEAVPAARYRAALGRLERSAALLVLGSSLAVGSGYRFVTTAARQGLPVAIVTQGPTRADHHATLRIDAALRDVLPTVLDGLGAPAAAPAGIVPGTS